MSDEIQKTVEPKAEVKTLNKSFTEQSGMPILRKITRPFAVVTIVMVMISIFMGWLWAFIAYFGVSTEQQEAWDLIEKVSGPLATVTKALFIISTILALLICGLMIAHTAIAGAKTRKNHLKTEMPTTIFNGLLSIFLFAMSILMLANMFGEYKFVIKYSDKLSYPGESFDKFMMWIGMILAFVIYFNEFARAFNKKLYAKLDTNTKSQRALAMSNGSTAICLSLPLLLVIVSGFLGEQTYQAKELLPMVKSGVYYAGYYASQVAILALMTIAGKTLLQVGLVFLKKNDGKRIPNCITWGVIGVVMFVFWIIYAVFMKASSQDHMAKWFESDGQKTCAIFALITWLIALGDGIFSMIKAKSFVKEAQA